MTSLPPERRLSIGLPVYNGERYLAASLDSLLRQTFRDFEIVICDNASTDGTRGICEAYAARDSRIRYVRNQTNIGASPNFAAVARLTSAQLFKWSAHDDLYAETYLERCIDILDRNPDVVLAHCDATFIDENAQPFAPAERPGGCIDPISGAEFIIDRVDLGESASPLRRFADVLFHSLWGTHMFGVIRRSALDRTASIQDVPNSDRPLLAELALLGRFQNVREKLFLKRFHARMSLAMKGRDIVSYVSGGSANYWKRGRQLKVYFSTPAGKPIGWVGKTACTGLVLAYCAHVAGRSLLSRHHPAVRPANRSGGKPAGTVAAFKAWP